MTLLWLKFRNGVQEATRSNLDTLTKNRKEHLLFLVFLSGDADFD